MSLQQVLESFREPVYVRVKRSSDTYQATANYVQNNLIRLTKLYRATKNDQQTLRLIRDDIDNSLRRYHDYCIKQNFGAHYIDPECTDAGIFEHIIPASTIRDLLLHNAITAQQACNMPTCRLSKHKDDLLREAGWSSKTPNIYHFWKRYEYCFDITDFTTYDGVLVNAQNWDLNKHFEYFIK